MFFHPAVVCNPHHSLKSSTTDQHNVFVLGFCEMQLTTYSLGVVLHRAALYVPHVNAFFQYVGRF